MGLTRRHTLGSLAALAALPGSPVRAQERSMRIGVIGAGWLGGTVGRTWVKSGHEVLFSTRHPEELVAMTKPLGTRATVGTPRDAAAFGSVILIAVPYTALPQTGQDLLRGKIVLDACNPAEHAEAETRGVGALSASHLPGARLVRAFSAVDVTAVEASFDRQSGKLGVPLASDDTQALQVAAQLVRDAGCEPVVVGDLATARGFSGAARGSVPTPQRRSCAAASACQPRVEFDQAQEQSRKSG